MCAGSFLDSFPNSVAKDIKCHFKAPETEANSLLTGAVILPAKKEVKNSGETEDLRWKMWGILNFLIRKEC